MPDDASFAPFDAKMREAGLPELAIRTFRHYYRQLRGGEAGLLGAAEIEPVESVTRLAELADYGEAGRRALVRTVVVKLNGGLGTGMGMTRAKSLLPVKPGHSFLDVIARQILALRRLHDAPVPLVLMNSFRTRDDSLAVLSRYPELATDLPPDFLQHKVPRILASDLGPVSWPAEPDYEWCPPGHGDLYPAMVTSGMLAALLSAGFEYAFVSNADNLGAVLDLEILGWFAERQLPFAMEVADRTEADRKGGHLARLRDGRLTLRESAQCPPEEEASFQDVSLHRFFNTNNLWVHLPSLRRAMDEQDGLLPLPMIRNDKSVDPTDPASPRVIQLETAMGSAISFVPGAEALCVPRTRFAPVKTCDDLLAVWSDAFRLTEDWRVVPDPEPPSPGPVVRLDPAFYKRIDDLGARFAEGAPSLRACRRLTVRGDVRFGAGVRCRGEVELVAPEGEVREVPPGAELGSEAGG